MSITRQTVMRSCVAVALGATLAGPTSAADQAPALTPRPEAPAEPASGLTCGSASDWEPATAMQVWRVAAAAVVADSHLFVLGGYVMGGSESALVESAAIGGDGALAEWTLTTPLTSPNQALGAAAMNGYVYVVGGWDGGQGLERVERAAVLADGALGAWEPQAPLGLAFGRVNLAAVATSTHLYALGGYNLSGADISREVQVAAINPDGSLGAWAATSAMLTGRRGFGAVIAGPYIYVLGGSEMHNPGAGRSVERAEILADGALGPWQALPALIRARLGVAALVADGYLFAVGGSVTDFQPTTDTVERAEILANGALGPWQLVDSLQLGRAGQTAGAFNGRFYIMGGHQNNDGLGYVAAESAEQVTTSALSVVTDNGVTINDGALFTNQAAVTLTITAQTGTPLMQVSNDGGFAGAVWQTCAGALPWTLTQYGVSTIPRVVYVKFKDAQGVVSGPYSDDIILDVTAPTGTVQVSALALMPAGDGQPVLGSAPPYRVFLPWISRAFCSPAACPPNVLLTLTASDDASGLGGLQVGTDPTFVFGPWEPFATSRALYLPSGAQTVYVRFRDYAGNISTVITATLGP